MSITNYISAFAELLEKGVLIGREDHTQNQQLKLEDHPMHLMVAAVLRKALNSHIMGDVADEYHAALAKTLAEKKALQAKISELTGEAVSADAPVEEAEAVEAVEPAAEVAEEANNGRV